MTVEQWLERVSAWTTTVADCQGLPDQNDLTELRAFLQKLHQQLSECGRPKVALTSLPKVGKLLGKLCRLESLKFQESIYQRVLQCVLALHTNQPSNSLEEKATTWAESQVRRDVSYDKASNPCRGVGETISCLVSQYDQRASLKLLESMVEDFKRVPSTRWDCTNNCLVPCPQLSSATVRDLSELCLPLVTGGDNAVAPLIESLLGCHGNSTKDGISPRFLQVVTATQDNAYTNQQCSLELSYAGRVSLWARHLPALESEFLHLVDALTRMMHPSKAHTKQLIVSRGLPKACAENPSMLTAVEALMELLLQHTEGSVFTLSLMHLFDQCAKESQHSLALPPHPSQHWPGLASLYSQLQADPRELPLDLLSLHVNNISNCLSQMPVSEPTRLFRAWLLLMQSEVWYPVVIRMLLLGKSDDVAACLNVLAWYNVPLVPDGHKRYKAELGDTVASLRGLCSKSSLQAHDLHYALSGFLRQGVHDGQVPNVVIRPLLMLFTLHGKGAQQILQDIVRVATGQDQPNAMVTFAYLLDSLEFSLPAVTPRSFRKKAREAVGDRGKLIAHTLRSCKAACEEYRRERAGAGALITSDDEWCSLLGRYNRIQELALQP